MSCGFFSSLYEFMIETQRPLGFVGGAIVGIFVGAIKGQTTETGFLNGAGIGAVTGALAGIQLLESAADCESLSKVMLYVQFNLEHEMQACLYALCIYIWIEK